MSMTVDVLCVKFGGAASEGLPARGGSRCGELQIEAYTEFCGAECEWTSYVSVYNHESGATELPFRKFDLQAKRRAQGVGNIRHPQ